MKFLGQGLQKLEHKQDRQTDETWYISITVRICIKHHIHPAHLATALVNTYISNAVVTCEIKLFQHHFSFCRCPLETILFQRVKTCLQLFQIYFSDLLQLMNVFPCVHCHWNNFGITSDFLQRLKQLYFIGWKLAWNYFKFISNAYCSSWMFSRTPSAAKIILFQFQIKIITVSDLLICEIKH